MVSYSLTGHCQQHQEENVAGGVADELYEGVLDVLSCNNSVSITLEDFTMPGELVKTTF